VKDSIYIGVIGSGDGVSDDVLNIAERVGIEIAKADAILVCGGRFGVMEAACRGAKSAGGLTVGILPGLSRNDANDFVDVAIPTGLGYALRNFITVRSSDAIIMLHGEIGTLSEVVFSYQHAVPVVSLENTGGWAKRLKDTALEDGAYLDTRQIMKVQYAREPKIAVQMAIESVGTLKKPDKI